MSFFVYHRGVVCETDSLASVLSRLADEMEECPGDEEHASVSVIHESEWGLGYYGGGYVTYEHVEDHGQPRHMTGLPRKKVLELMQSVAEGDLARLEDKPWSPGY
ncbi:hypothetical protein [Sphingomonas trueperi]|uniref:hypothetical protein n=1 Tax=Sphingomonas trueperi TaxID=53317 RepID=UPI000EB33404